MAHLVTPLRRRMLDDMKLRNMALSTRKVYVTSVATLLHGSVRLASGSTVGTRSRHRRVRHGVCAS
jgi:hypothetical protein